MYRYFIAYNFINDDFLKDKKVIWIDETAINSSSFKRYMYSKKNKDKILHERG